MEKDRKKYTVAGVQQNKLLEKGLDLKDGYILTYLRDMSQLKKIIKKKIDGKEHIWVDYRKLLLYLPILKINTEDALGRRLKRYETEGLILRHIHRSMNGSYPFFHLTDDFFDLFEISKIEETDDEYQKKLAEMGIEDIKEEEPDPCNINHPDEKSGGLGSKTEWVGMESRVDSDEKSGLNTPINNSPKNDTQKTTTSEQEGSSHSTIEESLIIKTLTKLEYKASPGTIKNLEKLSPTPERLEEVIKCALAKGKGAGFIIKAIKENYDLTLQKTTSSQIPGPYGNSPYGDVKEKRRGSTVYAGDRNSIFSDSSQRINPKEALIGEVFRATKDINLIARLNDFTLEEIQTYIKNNKIRN